MTPVTRKITYSAAATAIAVVCAVATVFLPVKIVPLLVCSLCFYIAFDQGGLPFGLVSVAATLLLTFFIGGGLTATFVFLGLVFAPYGIVAFFMRKLVYRNWKHVLLRALIVVAFVNLALVAVYFTIQHVVLGSGDLNLAVVIDKLGGYWVLALIASVLFISFDFLFTQLALTVLKNLPGSKRAKKPSMAPEGASSNAAPADRQSDWIDPFASDENPADKQSASLGTLAANENPTDGSEPPQKREDDPHESAEPPQEKDDGQKN